MLSARTSAAMAPPGAVDAAQLAREGLTATCWIRLGTGTKQPCALQLDFDGDGQRDSAILVTETGGKQRRGIALVLATGRIVRLGAGQAIGNGGRDFSWLDQWQVVPADKATRARHFTGDALLVEKSDSAGGLIGCMRGKPRWVQWGD